MIEFLSGAVTMGFAIASAFFLRFWRRTGDRLFLVFALAFWLLGEPVTGVQLAGSALVLGGMYLLSARKA